MLFLGEDLECRLTPLTLASLAWIENPKRSLEKGTGMAEPGNPP